ncbi:TerC family protein [Arthrobacter sp. zg-Y820]|uniref:TerC family protein n=1 Tax=unclassified Arthrobacter TaxID=235627 RepID=UPI001E30F1A6|nr:MULTISPECIES: TerC family protein [unclassified Arthrobacter]MCC9196590.1 TerC family protein [Arthrobacter sp. zg-Y820]MDK1279452.1 TerC family protein [Arthrobacter sp. zg.Y820]MDK1358929.1 TerC family protein [Arthrobacter sp. zg-Y1219]WIB08169.1 TerC family protein [Arthrobacter sp. zg-Y820]
MPELPVVFEVGTFVVLGLVLLFDLLLVVKRPHEPSMKEAGLWVGFYVGLALAFAGAMFVFTGPEYGSQFVAGWVTEYSLSIDNLFVFIIIMARFSVPRKYQQEVLMFGIIIALILRGIFIIIGAAVIENFSWVFFIFGAFLLWTAYKQATDNGEDEEEGSDNKLIGKLRRVLPMTDKFDQGKIRTVVDGKKVFTPMLIVFITIGVTDLMFAVDSIPAIFGLTQSAFIVFTANIFALMGLRQLYFLLGGLMDRLIYLKHGLSVILAFIGVKLILHALHVNELPFINGGEHVAWAPEIPTFVSLAVILGTIVIATVASLLSPKAKAVQAVASLENALKVYRNLGEDAPHEERVEAYDKVTKSYQAATTVAKDRDDVKLPEVTDEARAHFLANDPRSQRGQ